MEVQTMTTETGIEELDDGRYKIDTTAKCPKTGKMVRRRKTLPQGTTLEDAIEARELLKADIKTAGEESAPARTTLASYAKKWIKAKKARLKPRVYKLYRTVLVRNVLPELGDIYLDALVRADVEGWVSWAESQRKKKGGAYTQDTLRSWWRVLVTMLRDAHADGHISRDPTHRVRPPESWVEPVRETRTLTMTELDALLEAAEAFAPQRYAEIITLAYTGLRIGELYGLSWEDVDEDAEVLHVRASFSRGHLTRPKTGVGREVYLPEPVAAALRDHRQELLREQHPGLEDGIVFPSEVGTRREASSLYKALDLCAEAAKLSVNVRPQVLRRTFNTLLVRAGVDRIVLRSQMGHTSEQMTRRYAGVDIEDKRRAWAAIARLEEAST
jgi:integrase